MEGTAVLLIDQGRLLHMNLDRELITEDEIRAVCHRQGIERIEEVEKAILETGGTISIFKRHPTRDEVFAAAVDRRLEAIEVLLKDRMRESHVPPSG